MFKKRILTAFIIIGIVLSGTFANPDVFNQEVYSNQTYEKVYDADNYQQPFASDRIIVAFKPGYEYQASLESSGLTLIKTLTPTYSAAASVIKNEIGLYSIENKTSQGVLDKINELRKNPAVAYAEPDYIVSISDTTPNDPSFSLLYGMQKISAPKAWDRHTGSKNVVVAVIDTGIDYTHNDLKNNMWKNPGEIAGNGVDDDNNGYIDDVYGWNFVSNTNYPMDDNSHGTHVAGTIGAVGNNSIGVAGVTWQTQLVALKFLDSSGFGSTSDAILAINYASRMGIAICNNSWGGGAYSQSLRDAIAAYGGLAACAAGNSGLNNDSIPHYPSGYDCSNIIAVAATDQNDNKPSFSNYGATSVDLGAPGSNIYSTTPGNGYGYKTGTSMATPHVSGAAAIIKAVYPSYSTAQIKTCILTNVDPVSSLNGKTVTGGRLNVGKCVTPASNNLIPVMTSNTSPSGVAASSSNYSNEYAPWKAFDGNNNSGTASRWISSASASMPQWISYKFNLATYAGSYYILPETGGCADRAPKNFRLQGSNDNVNWTTLDARTDINLSTWNGSGKTFNISNPGSYKTYRLYVTATNGSPVVSIQKLELYSNGNPNLIPVMTSNTSPSGVAASSSSYSSEYAPWKAFDGNNNSGTASRWISSASSYMPQWIYYKFNQAVNAKYYYILPETGGCADRAPKNFQLQGSNNGSSWTTLDTRSNINLSLYDSAGITFSINQPGSYTYYRLYVTATNGSSVVSIQQIKLFQ